MKTIAPPDTIPEQVDLITADLSFISLTLVLPHCLPWLKEGENTIEINVTNLWVNRMIGDRQPGEAPVTRVRRFYNAGDKLLPSGLLGPVKLIGYYGK